MDKEGLQEEASTIIYQAVSGQMVSFGSYNSCLNFSNGLAKQILALMPDVKAIERAELERILNRLKSIYATAPDVKSLEADISIFIEELKKGEDV